MQPARRKWKLFIKYIIASVIAGVFLSNCAAWPMLTGAAGLAAGKKNGGGIPFFFFLSGSGGGTDGGNSSPLDQIQISGPTSLAKTTAGQFHATAIYSNSTHSDITALVSWSSDSNSLSVAPDGTVTAADTGTGHIKIDYQGKSDQMAVTVTDAPLVSITVSCENQAKNLPIGIKRACTATGNLADATTQPLTAIATWSTDNTGVASVDGSGVVTGVGAGATTIRAAFGGKQGSLGLTVSGATIQSISIDPPNVALTVGQRWPFKATGTFSDGSTQPMTRQVTWSSDNLSVAGFSMQPNEEGLLIAESTGLANLTASWGGQSGTARASVFDYELKSIEITPPNPSLAKGTTLQLHAIGHLSNGAAPDITTQVSWYSNDTGVVTIDNSATNEGKATGLTMGGPVTIRAAIGGIEGTTSLTVTEAALQSIQVFITDPSIAKGTSTTAYATGLYTDGTSQNITSQVSWSTTGATINVSNITATSVDLISPNNGSTGTATIKASRLGITGSSNLTVSGARLVSIQVTPTNPTIALGETKAFTATGTYTDASTQDLTSQATWYSSNISVATISNAANTWGTATGLAEGATNIYAAFNPGTGLVTSPTTSLTVGAKKLKTITITPASPSIAKGTSVSLKATGTYTDGSTDNLTNQVSWTSDEPTVVSVSNVVGSQGQATGSNMGSTTVRATMILPDTSTVQGSTPFAVTAAELVSIQVNFADPSIARGTSTTAQAIGTYTDSSTQNLTDQVTWTSSNTGRVQVGVVSGNPAVVTLTSPKNGATGSSTITATLGAISGSSDLEVTNAALVSIQVDPTNPSIPLGLTQAFTAMGTYTDDTTIPLTSLVTWNSSNTTVATVSNADGSRGLATSIAPGSTNITATMSGITSPASTLTVGPKKLQTITIGPAPNLSIAKGRTQQFTAIGHYTDGSDDSATGGLTNQVTWTSDEASCATISNANGSQGLLTALTSANYLLCYNTKIAASLDPDGVGPEPAVVSASTTVDVTAAELDTITVSCTGGSSLPKGLTKQCQAAGTYSDGSGTDLTSTVSWTSNNANATVITGGGSAGLVTGVNQGSVVITATDGSSGKSGTFNLTVSAAIIVQIFVGPGDATIYTGPVQNTHQFTATGRYSDYPGTADQVLTAAVTWSASPAGIATVSNAGGSQGLATSVAGGITTISATDPGTGVFGTATLTVLAADTTAPTVQNVTSQGGSVIRVTFSEPVNSGEATATGLYRVALSAAVTGLCSDGSNYSGSPQAISVSNVAQVTSSVYDLTLASAPTAGTNYTVLLNRSGLHDLGLPAPNALGCPNSGSFTGQEQLNVVSAACTDTTHIILTFSKPVLSGNNVQSSAECNGSTECSYRYSLNGPKALGNIDNAKILNGEACGSQTPVSDSSRVCITHSVVQTGAFFTVIAANGVNDDGFVNAWGSIRNLADTENLQTAPKDRAIFKGCGTAPVDVSDGPLIDNPFGDGSDFGNLTDYNGHVYIGPNYLGNSAYRFGYDGSDPLPIYFTFTKDTNGTGGTSDNTGGSSYVTIGHKNCTRNITDLTTGCGPDNENGRGVFVTGSLWGTPYIFIAGAKYDQAVYGNYPDFSYIYYTSDLSNTLNFKYIDTGNITGSADAGASSLIVVNDRVYLGSAKKQANGDTSNAPDLGFVTFNTSDTGMDSPSYCTPGSNCDADDGNGAYTGGPYVRGRRFWINGMPYFGGRGSTTFDSPSPNYGYYVGVDTMFLFNGYIYAANGGYHRQDHNGSVIRSVDTTTTTPCSAAGNCPDWTEIAPRSNPKWYHTDGGTNWFSLDLAKLFDLIPADRAVSMFESYNGNLYMTRTICVTSNDTSGSWQSVIPTANSAYVGCLDGTYSNRRPQLWKCTPGTTGGTNVCDAGDWTMVADGGAGISNFGHSYNHSITMVKANGSRLYVAFDNDHGLELWRTKSGITNPGSNPDDWEMVGTNGLNNDTLNVQQFFSAVSVQPEAGGPYYLYLSVGKNSVPVKVYRQRND